MVDMNDNESNYQSTRLIRSISIIICWFHVTSVDSSNTIGMRAPKPFSRPLLGVALQDVLWHSPASSRNDTWCNSSLSWKKKTVKLRVFGPSGWKCSCSMVYMRNVWYGQFSHPSNWLKTIIIVRLPRSTYANLTQSTKLNVFWIHFPQNLPSDCESQQRCYRWPTTTSTQLPVACHMSSRLLAFGGGGGLALLDQKTQRYFPNWRLCLALFWKLQGRVFL